MEVREEWSCSHGGKEGAVPSEPAQPLLLLCPLSPLTQAQFMWMPLGTAPSTSVLGTHRDRGSWVLPQGARVWVRAAKPLRAQTLLRARGQSPRAAGRPRPQPGRNLGQRERKQAPWPGAGSSCLLAALPSALLGAILELSAPHGPRGERFLGLLRCLSPPGTAPPA